MRVLKLLLFTLCFVLFIVGLDHLLSSVPKLKNIYTTLKKEDADPAAIYYSDVEDVGVAEFELKHTKVK